MKFWQKTTALLLALLCCAPLSACGGGNSGDSTSDSSSSSSSPSNDPFKLATPILTMDNNVARWSAVANARTYLYKRGENEVEKTTNGLYVTLTDGQTLYVKALAEDGYTDSDWAQITYNYTDPYIAPPTWARTPTLSSFTGGSGTEYDRFEGTEGYYKINLTAGSSKYYSFSVPQAGQYALYTNKSKTGLNIERYDASSQYITPIPYPAQVLDNGTLYSYVHCSTIHFNDEWRAVYKISSTTNGEITIRFVRVADALQEPERIENSVEATEIVGQTQDLPASFAKTEVPWTTTDSPKYFYDEDYEMTFIDLVTGEEKTATGFYRYGEKGDENAPVIYAAITTPSRYLGEALSAIQYKGNNLSLHVDTDVDGNRYFDSYVDFIMNNGGEIDNANGGIPVAGDEDMLCYMNVTNKDGLFPVNQELFNFLQAYVNVNPPTVLGDSDPDDDVDDSISVNKEDYWLGFCYYYVEQALGTPNNPHILSVGENEVTLTARTSVYYKIEATQATQCTIVGSNGLMVHVDGIEGNFGADQNGFTLTAIEVPAGGILLQFTAMHTGTYTVTLS